MTRADLDSRRTPVDHEYGTCDRTCAKLLIYPDSFRHEDITRTLNVRPTAGANKGERIENRFGNIRIVKLTRWELSSEEHVQSKDVRAHLDWLLGQLASSHEALRDLQQHEVRMGVSCPWWSLGGHGGPTLWPEQMKVLAELNLECSFDVQFYPEEEGMGGSTF